MGISTYTQMGIISTCTYGLGQMGIISTYTYGLGLMGRTHIHTVWDKWV